MQRHRSRLALTLTEREEISRAVVTGQSIRSIATRLGRSPSTVSREIKRKGGQDCYRASQADKAAWDRAHRPTTCKLVEHRALARIVAGKLQMKGSPEQIAGWLKRTYPGDENYQVSHETLYRSLFIQSPWGTEERAGAALEAHASHASFTPSHAEDRQSRQNHRHSIN